MPGYFDDIFEGGSPSASRAYDAYVGGSDGPAYGPRPTNDVDYDITRMTDPLARFMGHIPMPRRAPPDINQEIAQWSRYGQPGAGSGGGGNGMQMQQNRSIWDILFGRGKQSMRGGVPFGGPPDINQEIAQWSRYGGAPTDRGSFPQASGAPTPLQPQAKPATKLSSAQDIAARINSMLGQPSAPPPVDFPDWSRVFGRADSDFRGSLPTPPDISPVNIPIRLGGDAPRPSHGGNRFGGQQFGGNRFGGATFGRSAIPSGILEESHGGPIPLMRGGYPELYNRPVRQGHFSTGGGQNYVGVEGGGDGRSDHIDAKLSPGEYVIDAESVAMLGDGNNNAGARKLDKMRQNIRKQKGNALAKGKFSPDAKKDAMEYLAHDGVSDGLRRRGKERE